VRPHYDWGIIAVWCCAEMHYFERTRDLQFAEDLLREARLFLNDVKENREPEPFGTAIELPYITTRWSNEKGKTLRLDEATADNLRLLERLQMYDHLTASAGNRESEAKKIKAELLATATDAECVYLPEGCNYRIRRCGSGKMIVPYFPGE